MLVTTSNIIHNKIIRLDDNITQEELEQTARYLNTEFGGKSLVAIRAEILELMRRGESAVRPLAQERDPALRYESGRRRICERRRLRRWRLEYPQ